MTVWKNISYPPPLQPGDTIGVTAPSAGVDKCQERLDLCLGHLRDMGFKVREGNCLRKNHKLVSDSRENRIRDLLEFWNDDEVKAIFPPWGGDILIHLLPLIPFNDLAAVAPKWILGYSDTSTLLFSLTLLTGIATAHGTTLVDMIPEQAGSLSQKWLDVLTAGQGQSIQYSPSEHYQVKSKDWAKKPGTKFNLTEPTEWKCMLKGKPASGLRVRGRAIGGCLETLSPLVGTPYGDIKAFKDRFTEDGTILYLENAASTPAEVCRMLWNMRLAGWFEGLAGILLGRSGDDSNSEGFTYLDAVCDALGDVEVPIIYDMDIGHRPPQMTLVNGALMDVRYTEQNKTLTLTLS